MPAIGRRCLKGARPCLTVSGTSAASFSTSVSPCPESEITSKAGKRSIIADLFQHANLGDKPNSPSERQLDDLKHYLQTKQGIKAYGTFQLLASTSDGLKGCDAQLYNALLRLMRRFARSTHGVDSRENRVHTAERIIMEMLKRKVAPNTATFAALANAYALNGQVADVERVLYEVEQRGWVMMNGEAIRMLAVAETDPAKATQELKRVFEKKGVDPQRYNSVYNAVLDKTSREDNEAVFDKVLALGRKHGLQPDAATFDILINHFSVKVGNMDEARALIAEKESRGMVPGTRTYNALLRGASNENDWTRLLAIFEEMRNKGIAYDAGSYTFAINAYAAQGKALQAMRVFIDMLAAKQRPSDASRSAIARAIIHGTKAEDSVALLISRAGGFVAYKIFRHIAQGMADQRQFVRLASLFKEMEVERQKKPHLWVPDFYLLGQEISSYARESMIEDARILFEKHYLPTDGGGVDFGPRPSEEKAYGFNAMLIAYGGTANRDPIKAREVYRQMVERDIPVSNVTIDALLASTCSDQMLKIDEQVLGYLRDASARNLLVKARAGTPKRGKPGTLINQALTAIGHGDIKAGIARISQGEDVDIAGEALVAQLHPTAFARSLGLESLKTKDGQKDAVEEAAS
ncbi:hypothetical protein HKX48_000646 [Thoreauomyces humboldtii]|nr:hypothetical protein HKX48_000646 [Thoreauomyces humboldtii]